MIKRPIYIYVVPYEAHVMKIQDIQCMNGHLMHIYIWKRDLYIWKRDLYVWKRDL